MGKSKLKLKKYLAGLALVLLVVSVIGLLKIGNFDKLAGKIKVEDARLANASSKLNASIFDIESDNTITSNGYDEINYEIKYKLSESDQARDVIILGTLNDDEPYASFKKVTGNNITSTLSNNNRRIEIVISDVPANTEITTNIALLINGAPDGYTVNPRIRIKESTSDEYGDINTNPVEVSTNNLRGIIRNQDNEGISNIIVSLYKNRELVKETYTNSEGRYIFSDIQAGTYTVKVNEEIYRSISADEIEISGDSTLDLITERVYPFNLEVHKYITKVDAYNNGALTTRSYDNANLVNFPIDRLNILTGKVYYKIVVQNTGEKEGTISLVKDELPEFMTFNAEENSGFELKDGIIYDRNLEGITLYPGETREDSLVLNILDTNEARTYLNRVNVDGEIYEHVVYILDGNTYKEQDVLEGETITRPADPTPNFGGWYTDNKYTNLYNYNNPVTKNLVLYGKTTQKYNVEFYDKDPETGNETLYDEEEVPAGDPVGEPENHPEYTGYDFNYWCTVDNVKYIFSTPVTDNLKLITCYTIKQYDVNFYNYQDTIEKTSKVEYKHLIDESEAPTFDETGYTFICWTNDKENCYDFTTPVTNNLDLYPKHERLNNAVVFNDENRITTVEVPYGDTTNPIADQGKEGHTFRCWSEDRENCFDFATPIIKNTTVYAIYDINHYTVSFIDKDPEGIEPDAPYGDSQIIEWNGKATRPTIDPTHIGYTFSEWTKTDGTTYNFETPVTEDIVLISKYNINTYPVRFHNDSEVTTVNAQYKHKVTPIESPTKDHHIFSSWLDINNLPFDFDTLIVEETDLYASFEEVLPPKISHTPTMWTNSNVTVTIEKNDLVDDDTGYSYLYKTDESTYSNYENPFTITENTTIIAKSVKQNIDSVVSNREIRNIDKLNPTITLFSENSVSRNTATLNVSSLDNESGINYYEIYQDNVKVGEKHFECYSETSFDEYEYCRRNLPAERVDTYTVTGLSQSTTYTFKVKVFDKAGNFVMSDEIEVTTTEPVVIARLIGYNGEPLQEENYINFESLEEAFTYGSDTSDLYDCQNVQCTIQMVRSTNESVQVLDTQDLTLDLNGKVVSGINGEYTVKNNGDFKLIDSTPEEDDAGKLVNTLGTAILNKTGANLTLGDGYTDREVPGSFVSTTRPYVYGEKVGIKVEDNSNFIFFDGKIVAPSSQVQGEGAVNGRVDAAEYSYEAVSNKTTIDGRDYQVITLSQLVDPEARINTSLYFSKLSSAVNNANIGSSHMESESGNLMTDLTPDLEYYFVYDPDTNTLTSNNDVSSTMARSSIIINLENEENDKLLTVDYVINPANNGTTIGYNKNSLSLYTNHGKTDGQTIQKFTTSPSSDVWYLEKGKVYVLKLAYSQAYMYNPPEGFEFGNMVINNIELSDHSENSSQSEKQSTISTREDDFYYDEDTNTIRSNTQYECNQSVAYSSTEIDLTGKEGQYEIIVNASVETYIGFGPNVYIFADEQDNTDVNRYNNVILSFRSDTSPEYPEQDNGFVVYGPSTGKMILEGGKKYYLKFLYQKYVNNTSDCPTQEEFIAHNNSDQLIIHSIDLVKLNNESETIDIFKSSVKDNLFEQLIDNSGGELFETDGVITTDNHTPSKTIKTKGEIDLTNNSKGGMLSLAYKVTQAEDGTTTTPTINAYIIRTVDGEVVENSLSWAGSTWVDEDGFTHRNYNLPAGYKYRLDVTFNTQNKASMTNYSNLIFKEVNYKELDTFEGNKLNGIYYDSGSYRDVVISSNTLVPDTYHDSYIKLDLTNYDKNQLLTFNTQFNDNYNVRYFVYLTNNNRALSRENIVNNRNLELAYLNKNKYPYYRNYDPSYSYQQGYYPSDSSSSAQNIFTRDYDVVLEKGQVYYLHFASIINSNVVSAAYGYYGNQSMRIEDIKLTPIDETVLDYGGIEVFTGTLDVDSKPAEQSSASKRDVSFDTMNLNHLPIYDYVYNEETGMYDPQNTEPYSVAAISLKFDLTEATEDKSYILYGSGYYAVGDEDDISKLEIASLLRNSSSPGYIYFSNGNNNLINLEKGKVYYIQVASYITSSGPNNNSFRIDELDRDNPTSDVEIANEVRQFNEEVDTVQLLKDVVVSDKPVEVEFEKEVILDLNGYSISTTNQNYVIDNSGDLTIIDSKETDQAIDEGTNTWSYDYSTSLQSFTAPESGYYTIEAWGAQGGYAYSAENHGGYGGYATGQVYLEKNQVIRFAVGGKGTDATRLGNNISFSGGKQDGNAGLGTTTSELGAGGGSTFVYYDNSSSTNIYGTYANSVLLAAAGGGGAYADNFDENSVPQNMVLGGDANVINSNYVYSNESTGGAKGTGGGYKRSLDRTEGTSSVGGMSFINPGLLTNGSLDIDTTIEPDESPVSNAYKIGNGHLKITLNKVANGSMSTTKTGTGTAIINNQEKGILTLKSGTYSTTGTNSRIINNNGDLILDGSTLIKVKSNQAIGINNLENGTITTQGGNPRISLETSGCSTSSYNTIGIKLNSGVTDLTNINVVGKNGVGIYIDSNASANIHKSFINIADSCSISTYTSALNNTSDTTETSDYDKNFTYSYKIYKQNSYATTYVNRFDGAVLNYGNTVFDTGSLIAGRINNNAGSLELIDGTSFNDLYLTGGSTTINNTDVTMNYSIYNEGILNFGKAGEESNYILRSSKNPNIINAGVLNTKGGEIASVYNLGTINTDNTDFEKLYNLNTYISKKPTLRGSYDKLINYNGTANIKGGTIKTNMLVNESDMTIDGTTVEKGILNRRFLTVKGNSNVTSDTKAGIFNEPFYLQYETLTLNGSTIPAPVYVTFPMSVTIGDNDGTVTNEPMISSTASTNAITGNCYYKKIGRYNNIVYRNYVDEDINFFKHTSNTTIYRISPNLLERDYGDMISLDNYYKDNTLCDLYYYDGTLSSNRGGPSNGATDIAMTEIASGNDIFVTNGTDGLKMNLIPINSPSRPDLFEVNGTSVKSLQAAIDLVPDNTPTTITQLNNGTYYTASPVVIPENKEITLSAGNTSFIHSKRPYITNNGTLTSIMTAFTRGQYVYENNNILNLNSGSYQSTITPFDNFFHEANLLKNNGTTSINGGYSNELDIVDKGNLTINNGINFSNGTIYSYGSNIVFNNPYISNTEGDKYNSITYFRDRDGKELLNNWFISKPTFKTYTNEEGNGSTVTINDIAYSNFFMGEFNNATVNINNSNTSYYFWLGNALLNNSTLNLIRGNFNMGDGYLRVSGTYNQENVNVTGAMTLANDAEVNIKSGTITTQGDDKPIIYLANNNKINVGIKGDSSTSKTVPTLTCGNYCFNNANDTTELNFYDGIFTGKINPVNAAINEIEDGYDLIYNRKKNPKEVYLDILPIVHNYTTGNDYFDIQQAFDEANTNDELILLRDYTNYADSPSLEIASTKKIKLYLNYILDFDADNQMVYTPYKEGDTVSDISQVETPIITINNADIVDENTGAVTEVPFIVNNGELTVYGSTLNNIPSRDSEKNANFISNSGARIITNNGTLKLNEISATSTISKGTMFKNTGTMSVRRSNFETSVNTVFDNTGVFNINASSSDTSACYNPTFIKVDAETLTEATDPTYRYNDKQSYIDSYRNSPIKETIINSGTMDITHLYVDAEYGYAVLQNEGTMNVTESSIEQMKKVVNKSTGAITYETRAVSSSSNYYSLPSIINVGTMNLDNVTTVITGRIYNKNELNIINDSQLNIIDDGITNISGKLTITDSVINSTNIGITSSTVYDTNITNSTINSNSQIWYNYNSTGNLIIDGGTYKSHGDGNMISAMEITSRGMIESCSNNSPVKNIISGSYKGTNESTSIPYIPYDSYTYKHRYHLFSGFAVDNMNVSIKDATIEYTNAFTPRTRSNSSGVALGTHALINSDNANVTLNNVTIDAKNNDKVYGVRTNADLNIVGSTIESITNYGVNNTVNIGVKDNANSATPKIEKISCDSSNTAGINLYDGYVYIDYNKLCLFADKETSYNIIGEDSKRYLSNEDYIKNVTQDHSYNSIDTAIANASNGDKLQLLKDISLLSTENAITIDGKEVELDLAGYNTNANISIINNAKLTLTDSVYISDNTKPRGRVGNITNTSGTLIINEGYVSSINNTSSLSINSGAVGTINTTSGTVTNATIDSINSSGNLSVTSTNVVNTITSSGGALNLDTVTVKTINNNGSTTLSMTNTQVSVAVNNNDTSTIVINDVNSTINTLYNYTSTPYTLSSGKISTLYNKRVTLTLEGVTINNAVYNTGNLIINAGYIYIINNSGDGNIELNGGETSIIYNKYTFCQNLSSRCYLSEYDNDFNSINFNGGHDTSSHASQYYAPTVTINGGNVIQSFNNRGIGTILGGTVTQVNMNKIITYSNDYGYNYDATLTIGTKDGIVSTTSPSINNQSSFAITTNQGSYYVKINFYDGKLTGKTQNSILSGEFTDMETNYLPTIVPDIDEHGDPTGAYSMILKLSTDTDTKIACVNGICYTTLQEAIDASAQNCGEDNVCPTVTIGDEIYFSIELDADLVLNPQYSLTIDLNHHNLNKNGYNIPENINVINGSIDGEDLNSSLARFLSNVFNANNSTKDIIITNMSDGNALDTAKTYNLYKYEDTAYLPIKVNSDGAGKYSYGKETLDMKSIKGRLYLNDMPAGEYKLKDNYDNELEFTIYEDGTLSPNIRENVVSEFGHLSASAVATLIITIQTGIIRFRFILIILLIIIGLAMLLLMKKNKSLNKKETTL